MMDGDIPEDRLQLLEPQTEDWHCFVCQHDVQHVQPRVHLKSVALIWKLYRWSVHGNSCAICIIY